MKNELMIDIETSGNSAGCKVLSIGAYGFNKNGEEVEFYCRFDAAKMDADGLNDDQATMDFWSRQGREAFEEAFSGKTEPATAAGAREVPSAATSAKSLPSSRARFLSTGCGSGNASARSSGSSVSTPHSSM